MRRLIRPLTAGGRIIATIAALVSGEDPARANPEPTSQGDGDYVVLLHGLGRTRYSMKRLEWALARRNYRVINRSWPSTRFSIQAAADQLNGTLNEYAKDRSIKVHFVTHSLGGIVLRQYLAEHPMDNVGRVVMLAPPNHGSELADKLRDNCLYRLVTGPSGQQLGTNSAGVPDNLGPPDFECGIIAGDRSLNPLFSSCIPGLNDGKLSVESARLAGARDFLIVHHSHTWMPWRRDVVSAATHFLQSGRF